MNGHVVVHRQDWNTGENVEALGPQLHPWSLRFWVKICGIVTMKPSLSLAASTGSSHHMSDASDTAASSGSESFNTSSVSGIKLAFERVSMAECIMGSHTSSMFGITNIF